METFLVFLGGMAVGGLLVFIWIASVLQDEDF